VIGGPHIPLAASYRAAWIETFDGLPPIWLHTAQPSPSVSNATFGAARNPLVTIGLEIVGTFPVHPVCASAVEVNTMIVAVKAATDMYRIKFPKLINAGPIAP
jgi:hypothetical protein